MHSNVTSKNVSWLHFSWTTLYIGRYSLSAADDGESNNSISSSAVIRREAAVYCRTAVRDIRLRHLLEARYIIPYPVLRSQLTRKLLIIAKYCVGPS